MEIVNKNSKEVDVLPTQEIAMTLSMMRRLAVKSLRTVSGMLDTLAETQTRLKSWLKFQVG